LKRNKHCPGFIIPSIYGYKRARDRFRYNVGKLTTKYPSMYGYFSTVYTHHRDVEADLCRPFVTSRVRLLYATTCSDAHDNTSTRVHVNYDRVTVYKIKRQRETNTGPMTKLSVKNLRSSWSNQQYNARCLRLTVKEVQFSPVTAEGPTDVLYRFQSCQLLHKCWKI